jgi:hypothetical protein
MRPHNPSKRESLANSEGTPREGSDLNLAAPFCHFVKLNLVLPSSPSNKINDLTEFGGHPPRRERSLREKCP